MPTQKPKTIRLPLWGWGALAVTIIATVIGIALSMPEHASWRYGACKVFLERIVKYPDTIKISVGGETRATASIVFADTNPFGSQQIRVFECHFSTDKQGRAILSKLTMDRKPLPDAVTKQYNDMLPLLASIETDTELPSDLPKELENLKE